MYIAVPFILAITQICALTVASIINGSFPGLGSTVKTLGDLPFDCVESEGQPPLRLSSCLDAWNMWDADHHEDTREIRVRRRPTFPGNHDIDLPWRWISGMEKPEQHYQILIAIVVVAKNYYLLQQPMDPAFLTFS